MNKPDGDTLERFAALIGLDWADGKHALCLQAAGRTDREADELEHRPETIDEWARGLRRRFRGRPVAIALELAKGPVVYALRKYEFLVLFPLNPATLAKYREMFSPSGAKDDPTDAELALEFLLKYPERLQPLDPQSAVKRHPVLRTKATSSLAQLLSRVCVRYQWVRGQASISLRHRGL